MSRWTTKNWRGKNYTLNLIMKKLIFVSLIILVINGVCFAQESAPFRQFYFNPYLLNPSFVGSKGYTEFGLVYRRQWLDINDSPTITGFNIQLPTYSRVSVGLNMVTQEVVALRNTSTLVTFGYSVPIAPDQFIRFGISGGMGLNNLNLNEGDYDPNDPVILNAMQNTYYLDGNFGVSYANKGLNLGFSFLNLFDTKYVKQTETNTASFNQLKNRLFSASYRFPVSSKRFQFEPVLLYRQSENEFDYLEGMAIAYYKDVVWLGGSYNNVKGAAFLFGAGINQFRFSYSYELPPIDKTFINTSSHEIQVSLRFGEKKGPVYKKKMNYVSAETTAVKDSSVATIKKPVEEPVVEEIPKAEIILQKDEVNPSPVSDSVIVQPEIQEKVEPVNSEKEIKATLPGSPPKSFTLGEGHYVVVGAFRIMQNAINYSRDLQRRGYENATVAMNEDNRLYYVYIYSSYEIDDAKRIRNINRVKRLFQDAWVLTIE
jgi:type IX secretion system PorP/SprF family membrane protein